MHQHKDDEIRRKDNDNQHSRSKYVFDMKWHWCECSSSSKFRVRPSGAGKSIEIKDQQRCTIYIRCLLLMLFLFVFAAAIMQISPQGGTSEGSSGLIWHSKSVILFRYIAEIQLSHGKRRRCEFELRAIYKAVTQRQRPFGSAALNPSKGPGR